MRSATPARIGPSDLAFRTGPGHPDIRSVRELVRATGFFSDEEEAVAAELVEERLAKGKPSGYEFVFAEQAETLVGYSCYGLIPLTRSSGWPIRSATPGRACS